MAPPLTARGMATRATILAAASQLAQEHSLAGLTTDEVCRVAAVSKSQLYHYFDTRDSLVEAVASQTVHEVLALQADLFAALDSLEGIKRWARALIDLQVQRDGKGGCPIGSLIGQTTEAQRLAHDILAHGLTEWTEAIQSALYAMQLRGEIPDHVDVQHEARLMMVAVQGGLLLTDAHRDPSWLDIALNERVVHLQEMCASL